MGKIKKILLASGRKNNWLWAFGLNLLFLASILIFCDIKYEVSDDFVMSTIISGAYGNGYNPHLMFINVLWGYLLLPFYHMAPGISWYLIAQLLVCLLSFTVVSYMLLERLERPVAFLFIIVLLTVFADDAYILVQFTKTAMIAVMGGGIVFLWILFHEKFRPLLIGAGLLCLAGTLIRFMTIYLAGGFFLIVLAVEFWKLLKEKEWKKIIRAAAAGGVLIIAAVGMKAADTFIYEQDEEYAFYKEYGTARVSVVDSSDYGYEAYKNELESLRVSENDYNMLRTWSFADNEYFTSDLLKNIGKIIEDYKEEVGISKEILIENFQVRKIWAYPICLACAGVFFFGIALYRKKWILDLILIGMCGIYFLYLFYTERTVYRVEYGIFLGLFLSMIFSRERKQYLLENIEIKRICGIIASICIALELLVYVPDTSYKEVTSDSRKEYIESFFDSSWDYDGRKYRKVVNEGEKSKGLLKEIEENENNFYFLDFQTTIQVLYYDFNPFKSLPSNFYNNHLYLAGVITNFPDYNKILKANDLENPLKSLVRSDVYLVDSNGESLESKLLYLREHYYPEADAKLYKEIDGYQIWKIYEK